MSITRGSIKRLGTDISSVLKFLSIGFLVFLLLENLFTNQLTMNPFKVPLEFERKGITGELLLKLTMDKYKEVTEEIFKETQFTGLIDSELDITSSIEQASEIGGAMNSIFNIIKKQLGQKSNEVTTRVADYPESFQIFIAFPEEPAREIEVLKDSTRKLKEHIGEMAEKIAFEFIKDQHPQLFLDYLKRIGYDLDNYEAYAVELMQHPKVDKIALLVDWGIRLAEEGKSKKGLRKIKEAMEIDSTNADVWAAIASFDFGLGDFEKAEANLQKALRFDSTHALTYSYFAQYYYYVKNDLAQGIHNLDLHLKYSKNKDRGYFLKSILYANELEKDSVAHYVYLMNQRSYSPAREMRIWSSYYGKIGDKEEMIKYLQRSLDYGFSIANTITLPPYTNYHKDTIFLDFLQKNEVYMP